MSVQKRIFTIQAQRKLKKSRIDSEKLKGGNHCITTRIERREEEC